MSQSTANDQHHRALLQSIARQAMLDRGLLPDFSPAALTELEQIQTQVVATQSASVRDLRQGLWASIDNDESRDLDQLTMAEITQGDEIKILVAVADVDSLVKDKSAIDEHAAHNTTSVYTAAQIFPMLPEKLSTELTSLNLEEDRPAIVIELLVGLDGTLKASELYPAIVRSKAKLAYNSVAAWLEGEAALPEAVARVPGLADNLRTQDKVAQSLRSFRHVNGALSLQTIQARPIFEGDQIRELEVEQKNRAKDIIEDFMIAANGVTARYLAAHDFPSIRRVVRTPKRWDRIVALASDHGSKLPLEPDSKALDAFLIKQQAADPVRYPDLSLAIIKLLGAGEYIAERPNAPAPGHFGLAVKDYAHSTAPNRRYPDLITQRLLKAALNGHTAPYGYDELGVLAQHFTTQEDAANKVERQVGKSAAALLLESQIGQYYDAIVTGASEKGTWVRLLSIPIEGKVVQGFAGLDVGNAVRVQLVSVSVERGFIDFKKVDRTKH